MRILRLPIKGLWRGQIDAGIKGDEYRDIKAYYVSRFFEGRLDPALRDLFELTISRSDAPLADIASEFGLKVREYDAVELIEGYGRAAPRSLYEWKGLSAGIGRVDWGAPRDKKVFQIHLGNKITQTPNF